MKQKRPELWYIDSAKAKVILFAAKSCELIIFFGGLWITLAVLNPEATGWANGVINRFFLTTLAFAIDAAFPESWIHAVLQRKQGQTTQFRWSVGIAIFMTLLVIFNIIAIVVKGLPNWIDPVLIVTRMAIGFGYVAIRETQGALSRHELDTVLPPALQNTSALFDSWPLVGMVALLQQQMEELASKQQVNLVDLQVQRLLSEIQHLQSEPVPEIDYDAITHCVMTRLQAQFDARQKVQIEAVPEDVTHQIDAPKLRQKPASARKNDVAKKTLTLRQPSASKTDKKSVIHSLLLQDLSLSSYYLAGQAHCSEATARRIKNEFIDRRHDAGQNDASGESVLTHDAMRHDA